jgi:hypothetical protein
MSIRKFASTSRNVGRANNGTCGGLGDRRTGMIRKLMQPSTCHDIPEILLSMLTMSM